MTPIKITCEWISVKQDLPEKEECVLVTNGKQTCYHFKQSAVNWEDDEGEDLYCAIGNRLYQQNKKGCLSDYECKIYPGEITYWMRLPQFPSYFLFTVPKELESKHMTELERESRDKVIEWLKAEENTKDLYVFFDFNTGVSGFFSNHCASPYNRAKFYWKCPWEEVKKGLENKRIVEHLKVKHNEGRCFPRDPFDLDEGFVSCCVGFRDMKS